MGQQIVSRCTGVVVVAVLAAAGCGCGGHSVAPSKSQADNDRLLALAPDQTQIAVVASAEALAMLDSAVARVRTLATSDPIAKLAAQAIDATAGPLFGAGGAPTLAALGFGGDRGLAFFEAEGGRVAIVPVVDRDRFVAALGGTRGDEGDHVMMAGVDMTCREVSARYVCASGPELFERLGRGSLAGKPAATGARGDIEVVLTSERPSVVTVSLAPGALDVRARIGGAAPLPLAAFTKRARRPDVSHASGFFAVAVPPRGFAALGNLLGGLPASIAGDATAVVPSGAADIEVRLPFSDASVARAFLDGCDSMSATSMLTLTRAGDGCTIEAAQIPGASAVAWLDGGTLIARKARDGLTPATGAPPTDAGRRLADGSWTLAFWGRGTSLAAPGFRGGWGPLPATEPTAMAMAYISELGGGVRVDDDGITIAVVVRTLFANPDPVVSRASELIRIAAAGDDISADLAALVAAHPHSPLAADAASGYVGLLMPTFVTGVLAAVAVPAFMDNQPRGRRSDSSTQAPGD